MYWLEEVLFFDGDEYYSSVIQKINEARSSISFECYIFENDEIGNQILASLASAANRNLDVRLMVDAIGSGPSISYLEEFCKKSVIKFKVFNPARFQFNFFSVINKRNHRKTVIIDQEAAFVGSFNVSKVHSIKLSGSSAWHDVAVYVKGPDVKDIQKAFHMAWNRSLHYLKFQATTQETVLLNSNMGLRYSLYQRFNKRLRQATKKILVTNAYFLPPRKEMKSLIKAAERKVFVGLCVPKNSDVWFVQAVSRLFYPKLLKAGVKIFEFQNSMLHAKTIIIDDWASVGSHNFNHRSFFHDLEIQIVLTQEANIRLLQKKWDEDVKNSTQIDPSHLPSMNLWTRLMTALGFWLRYWL